MASELGSMLSLFSLFIWNMFDIMHNLNQLVYTMGMSYTKKFYVHCTDAHSHSRRHTTM